MVNKNKWVYNYNNLIPNSQLEVAEAIAHTLRDNELSSHGNEYDKEKSRIIRDFFETIKLNADQNKELKELEEVLNRFENLSENNKAKAIEEIYKIVVKYLGVQEQEGKEKICEREGHIFDKWRHNKWTEYIEAVIDHQHVPHYPINRENWERTCSRCGFVEEAHFEPTELQEEKREKNRKTRIKKLETELKKLKGE